MFLACSNKVGVGAPALMQSKVERSKLLSLPIFGFAQVIKADEIRIFLGAENDSNSLGD